MFAEKNRNKSNQIKSNNLYSLNLELDSSKKLINTNYLQHNSQRYRKDDIEKLLKIPGGGGYLTCPWYGVVPFLRYLFHDRVRIYRYGFQ